MDDIIKDFHDLTEIPLFQQMIPPTDFIHYNVLNMSAL